MAPYPVESPQRVRIRASSVNFTVEPTSNVFVRSALTVSSRASFISSDAPTRPVIPKRVPQSIQVVFSCTHARITGSAKPLI
jgi:hypothetical protein